MHESRIDELVQAGMAADGIPGVVVAIDDPERGAFIRAYGVSDRASGTAMSVDDHCRIASVTKTFTADAVLKLVGQGDVSLDDPIATYVDGVPNGSSITVGDLLAMRGGVYDYTMDPAFGAAYTDDPTYPSWQLGDALTIMQAHASEFTTPDTTTVYSNSEYYLLGLLIEEVTGMPAGEFIRREVIDPLGLEDTSYPATTELPVPYARGYTDPQGAGGEDRDVTANNPAVPYTAGAMISTAEDMAGYAPLLATGHGLPTDLAEARQNWSPLTSSGVRLQYGLGVMQLGDWIGHDGAILGYSDMVFYLPAEEATVVVAVNRGDNESVTAQAIWGEIVKYLYPGSLTTWGS